MQRVLSLVLGLLIIAAVVGGTVAWAESDKDKSASGIAVDASYSGEQLEIAAGKTFTVTLDSNATTGFSWQLAGNSDDSVVELVNSEYQTSQATEGLMGAGGQEVWTFKALNKGESTISMQYSRPWETGVEPAETFELTVVVK